MAIMDGDKTESEVVYGRLKLEVPNGGDDAQVAPPHALAQRDLLERCLRERGIAFKNILHTVLEEPGCEKFRVYDYEIASHFFANHLLAAIRLFLNSTQVQRFPHHWKATIIIHSPSCFSNRVVSCHRYIPLAAVFFGNIQGGVFINHWEVSFRNASEACELEKKVAGSSLMRVDFLYDQNELVCVTFENRERSKTYSGEPVKKYRDGIAYYQITLRIGFIRRIIVDNAVSDRNGKNRTRIHFELNCPAVIRRGFVPDCEKSTLKNVKHERWLTIRRGCNPVEQPHPLAFADSPVFTIEFSDVPSDATIYAILSRLRVRSDLSIEFASYEITLQFGRSHLTTNNFVEDSTVYGIVRDLDYYPTEISAYHGKIVQLYTARSVFYFMENTYGDEKDQEYGQRLQNITDKVVNKLYLLDRCPYATWAKKCNEKVNAATDGEDRTIVAFLQDSSSSARSTIDEYTATHDYTFTYGFPKDLLLEMFSKKALGRNCDTC